MALLAQSVLTRLPLKILIMTNLLYDDRHWEAWSRKVEENFAAKRYQHFDHRFDFPRQKDKIRRLVADPELLAAHPFLPLLKVIIKTPRFRYNEKKAKLALGIKTRPISFAGHFDTYIYSYYASALNDRYQDYIHREDFDETVLAYRTDLEGKCNIQFSRDAFREIQKRGSCAAVALDIKGYFDSIDHRLLKEKWRKVLGVEELPPDQYAIYRSLTRYAYVNKNTFLRHFGIHLRKLERKPTLLHHLGTGSFQEKFQVLRDTNIIVKSSSHALTEDGKKRYYGIPQGLAISALLSNVYLIDYDQMMSKKAKDEGFYYRRYCDDILIVCDIGRGQELQQFAVDAIESYHLTIQEKKQELIYLMPNSKGEIRAFNGRKLMEDHPTLQTPEEEQRYYKSLQYLGFEFNGQDSFIRAGSISRYHRKMKGRILKTVYMAYSENAKGDRIFLQKLYHRYSHLGKRNFPRYAYTAAKAYYINSKGVRKEGMNSAAIRVQLSRHFTHLRHSLNQKHLQRVEYKARKGKLKQLKKA